MNSASSPHPWRKSVSVGFIARGWVAAIALMLAATATGQTVRVALPIEPHVLDMHIDERGDTLYVSQAVYESLTKQGYDGTVLPWLAETWEQLDEFGSAWRFKLREGVAFHSGNPFNAEAVKAHFDRMFDADDPGVQRGHISMIDRVEVADEFVVDFFLSRATGPFPGFLTQPHPAIIDVKEVERLGADYGLQPSGTGPFRVVEWRRGEYIAMEANSSYWNEGPYIDRLEFHFIPEASSRLAALETGEVDIVYKVPAHQAERLQAHPNLYVLTEPTLRHLHYMINHQDPILADVNVRAAIAHNIDREAIAEFVLGVGGIPAEGFLPPNVFGYLATPYEFNPEYSMWLLEDVGWRKNAQGIYEKEGQTLTVRALASVVWGLEATEAIQIAMRIIGIDFQVDLREQAYITNVMYGGEADFQIASWAPGIRTPDSSIALEGNYKRGAIFNPGRYDNEALESLIRIGVSGAPDAVRLAAYHDAMRILYTDVASIPVYQVVTVAAYQNRIDYRLHPIEIEFWHLLKVKD